MATPHADGLLALLDRLGVGDSINAHATADVLTRPLDIYRSHLAGLLVRLTRCEPQVAYDSIQEPGDNGDLEVVVPRLRIQGSNPKELAFELANKFPPTTLFDQPFEDGIHLRLYMSPQNLGRILLPYVRRRGKCYGVRQCPCITTPGAPKGSKPRVVVEFSSPNVGKEFDGAHLRSTIIGSSIASLYDGMGWDVRRVNFLGDWGKHVGLLAVGWPLFGSDNQLETEPLRHLLHVYTSVDKLSKAESLSAIQDVSAEPEIIGEAPTSSNATISTQQDEFFKKMEDGDSEALALWERFRNASVTEYAKLYAQLNIEFDEYSGESQVDKSTLAEVEAALRANAISEESNGAWIIDFSKHGSRGLGTVTLRHPNGTTSYLLRDVGAVVARKKQYHFDKMIYVVSARQDAHFQQVFRALELMGDEYHKLAQTLLHVNFKPVRGLSPQLGSSGLLLEDILEQCRNAIQDSIQSSGVDDSEAMKKVSEFARLAVIGQELSTKRANTFNFTFGTDEKIAALLESFPALGMQRWLDLLRSKTLGGEGSRNFEHGDLDYTLFEQEEAYADMLRLVARFPDVANHAFEKLDPSVIFAYLLQVVEMLPSVWEEDGHDAASTGPATSHKDAGEEPAPQQEASRCPDTLKSAFYDCVRVVLENGMNLTGLVPVKEQGQDTAAMVATLPQEVSEDPSPTTEPPQRNEDTTPATVTQEEKDNFEAGMVEVPQGADEVATELLDRLHVDEEVQPHATLQGNTEHDERTRLPRDGNDTEITTELREQSEEPSLGNVAQQTTEAACGATDDAVNEDVAIPDLPDDASMGPAGPPAQHEASRYDALAGVSGESSVDA